jgi:hypothetical protein
MSDNPDKIEIPEDVLAAMHEALSEELYLRVKTGAASAADLNVARQWLLDNKVAAAPARNPGLKKLGEAITHLPFDADGVRNPKAH